MKTVSIDIKLKNMENNKQNHMLRNIYIINKNKSVYKRCRSTMDSESFGRSLVGLFFFCLDKGKDFHENLTNCLILHCIYIYRSINSKFVL